MRLVRGLESNGKREWENMEVRTMLSVSTVVFATKVIPTPFPFVGVGVRSSMCSI